MINLSVGDFAVSLNWIPKRVSAFVAFTSRGYYLYFDLIKEPFIPLYFDMIPANNLSLCHVDISPCHAGGVTAFVALCSQKSKFLQL